MTTLLLIRHAENDYLGRKLAGRLPGIHLNATGCAHAQAVAESVRNLPIKAIFASPLERTMETAQPLAEILGLPIQTCDGLLEINFGAWQGKTIKQMKRMKLWKTVQQAPSQMTFPQGESFPEAQRRMVEAITGIAAGREDEEMVACFSHSDAIKLAVTHFLGMPLDNFQRLAIDPCSLTMLHLPKEGSPYLGLINQHMGLEFKPPAPKKKK